MSSADMNHESNSGVWPADPDGSMLPVLEASIEAETAKQRHPSASGDTPGIVLTHSDRCDQGCGAGALYRLRHDVGGYELDLCHHHKNANAPKMLAWTVVGQNPILMAELFKTNRSQGGDHA